MHGAADLSPTGRGVHAAIRAERLTAFEQWRGPTRIDFSTVLPLEEWDAYWRSCERVIDDMLKCQAVANSIRGRAIESIGGEGS